MATPGDFAERTFAWMLYRASGNQSLHAIHVFGIKGEPVIETYLRQRDCALELAWLEAGHRAAWLDAPLELFRKEAAQRGVQPLARNLVSQGSIANRTRGVMAPDTGHLLVLVPSPDPQNFPDSQEILRRKGESPQHQKFMVWAEVTYSQEFHELAVARSEVEQLDKFFLSRYKDWKKSQTPNTGTSLEALETSEASSSFAFSSSATSRPEDDEARPSEFAPQPEAAVSRPGFAPSEAAAEVVDPDYRTFKSLYPPNRFDEGKVKRAFEAKPKAERGLVIQHLCVYLGCERWRRSLAENDGQYIPWASTWLRTYDADPPAYFSPKSANDTKQRAATQRVAEMARSLRGGAS